VSTALWCRRCGKTEAQHDDFECQNEDYVPAQNAVLARLLEFVARCQSIVDASYGAGKRLLSVDPGGKRYARIVARDSGHTQGSVYCFVALENGDVLKSASWKAPAKGARGNILDADYGVARMTPYGAGYNR
jgi:hypothetical protein